MLQYPVLDQALLFRSDSREINSIILELSWSAITITLVQFSTNQTNSNQGRATVHQIILKSNKILLKDQEKATINDNYMHSNVQERKL